MRKPKNYSAFEHTVIAWMIGFCCVQPALAGTKGSYMASDGRGRAFDTVTYLGVAATASSPYVQNPCAQVDGGEAPVFNCANSVPLPSNFPGKAYCQSQGQSQYRWSIQASAVGGATCDNPLLEPFIVPANCASIDVNSSAVLTDAFSGLITVNAVASAGTALMLQAYEFPPGTPPQSLEELKAAGQLSFSLLLVGPFDLTEANCNALKLPFTTQNGHANLYFVADTAALSIPMEIACPEDVVFGCGDALVYPDVYVLSGGCGDPDLFTVTYDPAEEALPEGVATPVTATVTDTKGNTATCIFMATRQSLKFHGFFSPINSSGGSCSSPVYSAQRGSVIPVKFRTTCNGSTYSSGQPPTFRVVKCATGQTVSAGEVKLVANDWHGNWDTDGFAKGNYILIVTLQDGTEKSVSIKLK